MKTVLTSQMPSGVPVKKIHKIKILRLTFKILIKVKFFFSFCTSSIVLHSTHLIRGPLSQRMKMGIRPLGLVSRGPVLTKIEKAKSIKL